MSGQLVSDPLFVGLTRPSMIFGVSIQYAMYSGLIFQDKFSSSFVSHYLLF